MPKVACGIVLAVTVLGSGDAQGTGLAEPPTPATVVLGAKTLFVPYGKGWGTPHPSALSTGGDPSGHLWGLRWMHWRSSTSFAAGYTYLAPTLRRGWRKGRVELR